MGGFARLNRKSNFSEWINTGTETLVYLGRRAGELKYVGITKNFAARAAAHAHRFAIRPLEGLPALVRNKARAIEPVCNES